MNSFQILESKRDSINLLQKTFPNNKSLQDELLEIDKTPSKGDIPFIIKYYKENNDLDLLKQYFSDYYKLRSKNIPINLQQIRTFIDFTEKIDHENTKQQLKLKPKVQITTTNNEKPYNDEDVLADDEDVLILKSHSQNKCITYGHQMGQSYTFCISRPAGGNMYNSYRLSKHSTFYFIFFKKIPKSDIKHIMVLDKTKDGWMWTFADNNTQTTTWEQVITKFPVLEKYKDLFYNIPLTDYEKEKISKIQQMASEQTKELFLSLDDETRLDFIKSGVTLIDEIFELLPKELINEYISVGPNLTDKQVEKIKKLGKTFIDYYKKRREISIPMFEQQRKFFINEFDMEIEYIKQKIDEDYQKAYELVEDAKRNMKKILRISNFKYLIKLPKNIPEILNAIFDCSYNPSLTSLEGCPHTVDGFDCSYNPSLTSLEGCPHIVNGYFDCSNNASLISLEGCPHTVGVDFYCYNNPSLTSLEGCPHTVNENFYCTNNKSLTSLEGCPHTVGGNFVYDKHVFTEEDKLTAMENRRKKEESLNESFKTYFYYFIKDK